MYLWSTWTQASATSGVGAGAFRRRSRRRALSKSAKVGTSSVPELVAGGRCANLLALPICATLSKAGAWSPWTNHVMTSPVCHHFHFCWHSSSRAHWPCAQNVPAGVATIFKTFPFFWLRKNSRIWFWVASTAWTHVAARAHGQLAALRESGGGEGKKNIRHVEARGARFPRLYMCVRVRKTIFLDHLICTGLTVWLARCVFSLSCCGWPPPVQSQVRNLQQLDSVEASLSHTRCNLSLQKKCNPKVQTQHDNHRKHRLNSTSIKISARKKSKLQPVRSICKCYT